MPEVTAVLEVDGEPIKLRKVLREKWEKPRGSSIERYAGDTRDYYIDDVPLAENEYKRRIAELIDEQQFKLLTDVWAVTSKMHWKDRRTLLAEICGLPEDKQLLAAAPQFAELNEKVGRRTVDEYKSVLMKQRKDMNANLNTLPVRVDECSRMVAELESLDFAAAHSESDRLQAERERVQGELVKLTNNTLAAQARNELGTLQNQLRELEAENNAHLASQRVPVEDKTDELRRALSERKQDVDRLQRTIDHEKRYIADGETRLNDYRARWRAIDTEEFTETVCPTCHQPLPAEQVAEAREAFAAYQQQRKDTLLEDSKLVKQGIAAAQERLASAETALKSAQDEVQKAQAALDSYTPPVITEPENLPDYDRRRNAIQMLITDTEKRLDRLDSDTAAEKTRLETEHAELTRRKLESDAVLAKELTLADTRRRIAELQAEQRTAAAEVEQMDRLIAMCEEFTRYRVQAITESVNSKFRLTRWRLFQMLTAWRGKALTDAELDPAGDGFDLMQMAGVPAMLSVTVVEKDDGSKYNRIEAVTGFPKGLPAPQPESEILVFDADEPDMETFGKLPEWVQDIIRKSTQFADNAPEEKVDIPPEEPETPPDSKGACPI